MIKVQNISMKFRMNGDNIQSLKELTIAFLKRKIKYNDFWVFRNVSFEVKKGEVVGIIGRNGAGKSTMLKIISGILTPTEGKVTLNGKVVPMLELGSGFDFELTGRENIFLNGSILGYSEEFLKEKYDEIVEFSELGDFIETPIRNYSSGMMMRLAFSIATIVQPEILIVDEILAVGDEAFQRKSKRKMLELMGGGTTVLFVSHSIEQIREMCNRVIWLEKGKVKMQGETKLVCDEYQRYLDPTFGVEDKNQKASQAKKNLSDVLFIYGENDKEYDWRVTYQREQLVTDGIASNEINEEDIDIQIAKMYRVYICVGCHNTEKIKGVLKKAKQFGKSVFFDFSMFERANDEQRELLYEFDALDCDGIIVSNNELKQEFETKGFQVYLNSLALCEDMYKYAEWAVYDRDVLPFEDTKYMSENELINYNKAKQELKKRKEIGICTYIAGYAALENTQEELLKETVDNLNKFSELRLVVTTDLEQEKYSNIKDKIIRKSYYEKQDIFRIYADLDFVVLVSDGEEAYDDILVQVIYAASVKTMSIVLTKNQIIGNFTNGKDIIVCRNQRELCDTISFLMKSKKFIEQYAVEAYNTVYAFHSTLKTGDMFGQYVRRKMTKNIAFIIKNNEIKGRMWNALHHAALLQKNGCDVEILVQGSKQDNIFFDESELPVISRDMTYSYQDIEIAVAVDIDSVRWVQEYAKIQNKYFFIQGNEVEYNSKGDIRRLEENQMYMPFSNLSYIVSEKWIQKELKQKYGQKSIIIPNGVDCKKLVVKEKKRKERTRILYIGSRANQLDHFIEALKIFNRLDKDQFDIYIYINEKEKQEDLEEWNVLTSLNQDEVYDIIKMCDILLYTSEKQSHQQTILQMLASGGVAVIRDDKYLEKNLRDSENCLIYHAGMIEEAVNKINSINENEDYKNVIVGNGMKLAQKYDWRNLNPKIENVYEN